MSQGAGTIIHSEPTARGGFVRLVVGDQSFVLLCDDARDIGRELIRNASRARIRLAEEQKP